MFDSKSIVLKQTNTGFCRWMAPRLFKMVYAHLHDPDDARPTFKNLRLITLFEVEMAMLGLYLRDQFMSKTLEIVP